ncbi:MAG: hypothetical protein LBE82_10220 [Chitinophagaceae bacterium]|nr:hypothetical protein [Chitinophagaceae bacterium]
MYKVNTTIGYENEIMEQITANPAMVRKRLHRIIDEIEDVSAINLYELLKNYDNNFIYTDDFIKALDDDYENYLNGGIVYSQAEVDKRTDELLKSLRSK